MNPLSPFFASFWNDESHTALMARYVMEKGLPITNTGFSQGLYQSALYYITALSFSIFGISEWAGRLPSVLAWIALIISGVYISRKMFGTRASVITGFLLTFSQIQLAWATQLRPYIWMELFVVWIVYHLYRYLQDDKYLIDRNLITASVLSGVSVLFHGIGLLNLVLISAVFLYQIVRQKKYIYLTIIPVVALFGVAIIYHSFYGGWDFVITTLTRFHWSTSHYRVFLTHHYLWLVAGSLVGSLALYKVDKRLTFLLAGSVAFIFFMAILKINPRYVRYSLPAFPLMYLLFSAGITSVIEWITRKTLWRWALVVLVFALLAQTGKFVFWPQPYYSINVDMRENPLVDYRLAFSQIKDLIAGQGDVLVIDSWNDRVPYYLPGQKFIMANFATPTGIDPVFGEEFVGTVDGIRDQIASHSAGVAIVEDWQSFMSEDIKDYIRQNLKYEFTTREIPGNTGDHWSISIYSWGI